MSYHENDLFESNGQEYIELPYEEVVETSAEIFKESFAGDTIAENYIGEFLTHDDSISDVEACDSLQAQLSLRISELQNEIAPFEVGDKSEVNSLDAQDEPDDLERYEEKYENHAKWLSDNESSLRLPRDTFQAYHKMGEVYNAYKGDIEINGRVPSKADVAISVVSFIRSNLPESLIMEVVRTAFGTEKEQNDVDRPENDGKDMTEKSEAKEDGLAEIAAPDDKDAISDDPMIFEDSLRVEEGAITVDDNSKIDQSEELDYFKVMLSDTDAGGLDPSEINEKAEGDPTEKEGQLIEARTAATGDIFENEDKTDDFEKVFEDLFGAQSVKDDDDEVSFDEMENFEAALERLSDIVNELPQTMSLSELAETIGDAYVNAYLTAIEGGASPDETSEIGTQIMSGISNVLGEDLGNQVADQISQAIRDKDIDADVIDSIENSLEGVLHIEAEEPAYLEVDGMAIKDGTLINSITGDLDVGAFSSDKAADVAVEKAKDSIDDYMKDVDLNDLDQKSKDVEGEEDFDKADLEMDEEDNHLEFIDDFDADNDFAMDSGKFESEEVAEDLETDDLYFE